MFRSEGLDFILSVQSGLAVHSVRVLRTSVTSIREKLADGKKFCCSSQTQMINITGDQRLGTRVSKS